ncbi:MAG: carboxypeptidase-like regulatory domain-containing protein [Candidatus Acidiferrales bacterium]
MRRSGIFVVLYVTLAFATCTPAQNLFGVGALEGQVVDSHGKPVADASVSIQTSDGLHPHATHTDSSGHFEFQRYSAGQYDVRAYYKGSFTDWSKRQLIRPKKTTEITLKLPADSAETVVVPSK